MIVTLVVISCSIAALTGIIAVGSGKHWNFTPADYLKGKVNALLYLWVICSTIGSIYRSGEALEYGLRNDWLLASPTDVRGMVLTAMAAAVVTVLHIMVAYMLAKSGDVLQKHVWRNSDAD